MQLHCSSSQIKSCLSHKLTSVTKKLDIICCAIPHVQVYKSHLVETGGGSGPTLDSAHANLANTFVNAFVNAGFGQVQHMRGSLAASWLLH